MNKILILGAFKKASVELKKQGKEKPSLTEISEVLSNYVDEHENFSLGERTYRDYFNEAKKLENESEDISVKQLMVINGLCKYLGFKGYQDFVESIEGAKDNNTMRTLPVFLKKYRIAFVIGFILISIVCLSTYVTRQRWMEWQERHYVEVQFDSKKLSDGSLKAYKEDRIEHFRLVQPNCQSSFFKEDGAENLWYGKNKDGELEYFTALGLHPETGKTLKKITLHMIKKYICADYR